MSIAQGMIDIIREEMRKHNAKVLKSVHLNIGQMAGVMPDSLTFCFELITADTEMEGAELIMEIIPLKGICKACEQEFDIKDYAFSCPLCKSRDIDTISGHDLSIVEIEVE